MNALGAAWLPGLVFFLLSVWLVRKVIKAARTERDLEEQRLAAALGADVEALRARSSPPAAAGPSRAIVPGADAAPCRPEHLAVIGKLLAGSRGPGDPGGVEVVWARSAGEYAAWCERRWPSGPVATAEPAREILCVALVRDGKLVSRWGYGPA